MDKRQFLCLWYGPTYGTNAAVVDATFFNHENGYDAAEISTIVLKMHVGQGLVIEAGHMVTRLPDTDFIELVVTVSETK